jgi:4-hydroxybenzoate polyprenyltransferase
VLQLLRPKQWTKNLLLFAALVFARKLLDPQAAITATLAFVAFCLASSSVYVLNDLIDAERDRLHPEKRHRPIASGQVSSSAALALSVVLTVAALAMGFWIGFEFGVSIVIYATMSHFYSTTGKHIVILDTMLVAIGFVLRAIAGALAIDVPFSDWFVLCTLFVALFIALSKRKAEFQASGANSGARPVLAKYTANSLTAFTGTSMAAAVISYSLYVQDVLAENGNQFRLLLFTVPIVIVAIFRYFLLVDSGRAGEKPEETLLKDRSLQLSILGFMIVAIAAFYGGS